MDHKILLQKNPSPEELELINKYWQYEDYEFKYKPTILAKDYQLSRTELLKTVRNYSVCILTSECLECGMEITYEVHTQTKFRETMTKYTILCDAHRQELYDNARITGASYREAKLKAAIDYEVWNTLKEQELRFFKSLVIIGSRDLIFQMLFENDKTKDRLKWLMIDKFERLALLTVKWSKDNKIEKFIFHPSIKFHFIDTKIDNLVIPEVQLGALLKERRTSSNKQPTHSMKLIFNKDVIIQKSKEYLFSAWLSSVDHSISIKLTPLELIKNGQEIENDIRLPSFVKDFEPKNSDKESTESDFDQFDDSDEIPY